MKIIIDSRGMQHSPFRGLGEYSYHLIKNLLSIDKENNYELYFDPNLPVEGHYRYLLEKRHVFGSKQPFYLPFHGTFYYRFWLKRQLAKLNYDLIHFASQIHLPPVLPKNSIVTVHDLIHLALKDSYYKHDFAYKADVAYMSKILNSSRLLITDSLNTKNDILNILNINECKVKVVYLGIDEAFFKPISTEEIKKIIAKHALPDKYIFYYGGCESRKNISALINAFSLLVKELPDIKLVIATNPDDPPSREILKKALSLGLSQNMFMLPSLPNNELIAVLKNAQAMVMPSLYEGFGLPPLEANACGTPVASSPASSLKEVLGDAALFFNPMEVLDMKEKIKTILLDNTLRQSLIVKGLKNAARFSWKRCAEQTLELYNRIKHEYK
jgi:glycosyltransferase involved in cell wall biosynthesis